MRDRVSRGIFLAVPYPFGDPVGCNLCPNGLHSDMQTVAETPTFTRQAEKLLSAADKAEVIDFLAQNPEAGDMIPGTGGVRKVRAALKGRGKRGGARVIYYYHSDAIPLFALLIYAKNEKADMTPAEKKVIAGLVEALKTRKPK